MRYTIKFAPDHLMPRNRYWMLCRSEGATILFLRRSMVCLADEERADILEEAWAGCRAIEMGDYVSVEPVVA